MPHKPKRDFKDTRTPANVTEGSVWALSASAALTDLAHWAIEPEWLAATIAEVTATGSAITFGGLRSGQGMSVRITEGGQPVLQRYLDDAFDLNELLNELMTRGRTEREAREAREAAKAAPPPPQVG